MNMLGAAVEELWSLASRLRAKRDAIDAMIAEMTPLIEGIEWKGADRDRFVDEWHTIHRPSLFRLATDLIDGAVEVGQAAERQAQASSAD